MCDTNYDHRCKIVYTNRKQYWRVSTMYMYTVVGNLTRNFKVNLFISYSIGIGFGFRQADNVYIIRDIINYMSLILQMIIYP